MELTVLALLLGLTTVVSVGGLVASLLHRDTLRARVRQELTQAVRAEAEASAARLLERERAASAEREANVRLALEEGEARARRREDGLDRRLEGIEERERALQAGEAALKVGRAQLEAERAQLGTRVSELERQESKQLRELERVSGLRKEEALRELLGKVEERARGEVGGVLERVEGELVEELGRRSREGLLRAVQRVPWRRIESALVTSVPLPDDEVKLGLVGRDGRNARALEEATGVDVLIDDPPGEVVVSSFDPVRRELARRVVRRLVEEGQIHPERIVEVVGEEREALMEGVGELGAEAAREAAVEGLSEEVRCAVGRLEFAAVEDQSGRRFVVEVAKLAGAIAEELGFAGGVARRVGLLHAVGWTLPQEADGGDVWAAGAAWLRAGGETEDVVAAVAGLGSEGEAQPWAGAVVGLARRLVAERPGGRAAPVELVVRRQQALEATALRHQGVVRAYAVQAGRELRVWVDADKLSDKTAHRLARELQREFESDPPALGAPRVCVIRHVELTP